MINQPQMINNLTDCCTTIQTPAYSNTLYPSISWVNIPLQETKNNFSNIPNSLQSMVQPIKPEQKIIEESSMDLVNINSDDLPQGYYCHACGSYVMSKDFPQRLRVRYCKYCGARFNKITDSYGEDCTPQEWLDGIL